MFKIRAGFRNKVRGFNVAFIKNFHTQRLRIEICLSVNAIFSAFEPQA
jgi:hypothetical protein